MAAETRCGRILFFWNYGRMKNMETQGDTFNNYLLIKLPYFNTASFNLQNGVFKCDDVFYAK